MEAHRVAVLSDTHGILRPEVVDTLRTCEAILHGGDVGDPEIVSRMEEIGPTYVVRGNTDNKGWAEGLPEELAITLFGFRIYMTHDKRHIPEDLSEIDIVIYGHSHKYEEIACGRIRRLNPGSCGPKRFRLPVTMMVLTLYPAEHRIETKKVDYTPGSARKFSEAYYRLSDKDMYQLIRRIMKDVDDGKGIASIAASRHVEKEFAEEICRMYLTHPGVDVDGIMDRMERKSTRGNSFRER